VLSAPTPMRSSVRTAVSTATGGTCLLQAVPWQVRACLQRDRLRCGQSRRNDTVDYHVAVSPTATKSNSGQPLAPGGDTPGVIAPPPLIYLGGLGVGFAINAVAGGAPLPSTVARPVGAALIVAGAGLMGTFVRAFGRARTSVDPYSPSETIVTDGPYRLTRNPGYLGMTLTYVGIAIAWMRPGRSSRFRS
jgi:Phospholipid methyltransferase